MYNVHITDAVAQRAHVLSYCQTIDQNVDDQGVSFRIPILEAIVTRANTGPRPRPLIAAVSLKVCTTQWATKVRMLIDEKTRR